MKIKFHSIWQKWLICFFYGLPTLCRLFKDKTMWIVRIILVLQLTIFSEQWLFSRYRSYYLTHKWRKEINLHLCQVYLHVGVAKMSEEHPKNGYQAILMDKSISSNESYWTYTENILKIWFSLDFENSLIRYTHLHTYQIKVASLINLVLESVKSLQSTNSEAI